MAPLPEDPWKAGIYDMARDARGRLLVVGGISPRGDDGRLEAGTALARFRPNGLLDSSFGGMGFVDASFGSEGSGVAVQPDQKVVAVGYANWGHSADINHKYSATIARFNPDGSLDRSFNGGRVETPLVSAARDVAIQANGRIVVVAIEAPYFEATGVVLGFKPNGRVDRSFGKRGRVSVFAPKSDYRSADLSDVFVQPDGKLLVAGMIEGRILLERLLPNGSPDPGFGGGDGRTAVQFSPEGCACSAAHAVRLQSDGRIVVLAHEEHNGRAAIVTRFLPDGRLDRSFGPGGRGFARHPSSFALGLAVAKNDKLVIAGQSDGREGPNFMVLRYSANGQPDRSFGSAGAWMPRLGEKSFATSALVEPNGRIVVAGASFRKTSNGAERAFTLQRFAP